MISFVNIDASSEFDSDVFFAMVLAISLFTTFLVVSKEELLNELLGKV
jgi:hypothetical protein